MFAPHSTSEHETYEDNYRHVKACSYLRVAVVLPEVPVSSAVAPAEVEILPDEPILREIPADLTCPLCDKYQGKNLRGFLSHVRAAHPDNLPEFKR